MAVMKALKSSVEKRSDADKKKAEKKQAMKSAMKAMKKKMAEKNGKISKLYLPLIPIWQHLLNFEFLPIWQFAFANLP